MRSFLLCHICMSVFPAMMYVQLKGVVQEDPSPDHRGEDGGPVNFFLISLPAILLIHVFFRYGHGFCRRMTISLVSESFSPYKRTSKNRRLQATRLPDSRTKNLLLGEGKE